MKLLVDVGNTAIKLASHQDGKISFLAADKIQWQDVEHVLVASVRTNTALNSLLEQAKCHGVKVTIAAVSAKHNGVSCAYKAYQNLGVDRWLVVLAAAKLYPGRTSLIVDAGTATTLDVLIDGKQHLGGWIVPGIDLMICADLAQLVEQLTCNQ